ncbi:amino acid-binding protein [Actinomadura sp. HBU206391]|uniref:amino acid-binding protein n=1 Tax=Actinomadura sp. HBU206391 TaxID=2731692 RepID=UPI00164F5B3E|nr:amino acid-binding protein [Actinomadura sp. HBU206391]MBC6459706.1 amino acid-binding protein [Actinomadura sp. HBU206391]
MLLRVRVRLPDRPGSLGKVARTLGAAGADVVQMVVLERDAGRALDDLTVAWPSGAGIDRLCDGLASIPGVEIIGVWPTAEPQGAFPDAALIGQLAANPDGGLVILTDAVPAILSADWAGLLRPARPGAVDHERERGDVVVLHSSVGAFGDIDIPDVNPIRPRSFTAKDGTQYTVAPIADGELALLVARTGAPPFHRTEVFRLAQLVSAAEAVLTARHGTIPAEVEAV